jgi:hypothetical protein
VIHQIDDDWFFCRGLRLDLCRRSCKGPSLVCDSRFASFDEKCLLYYPPIQFYMLWIDFLIRAADQSVNKLRPRDTSNVDAAKCTVENFETSTGRRKLFV